MMNTYLPRFKLPIEMTEGFALLRRQLSLWCYALPWGWRSPVWPVTLATLVIFGMLAAFHEVVRGAVLQGEQQRKASALQVEANWRCNTVKDLRARDNCLWQLNTAAYAEAGLRAPDVSRL